MSVAAPARPRVLPGPRVDRRSAARPLLRAAGLAGIVLAAGVVVSFRPFDALGLAVSAVLGLAGVVLSRRIARDEGASAARLFLFAFVLRVVAVYLLYHVFYTRDPALLAPDEVGHDRDGALIAAYLRGEGGLSPKLSYDAYVGVLQFAAPGFALLPRLVNAFGGAMTAVVAGAAAANVFGPRAGRAAGVIVAVWPSAVVWSSLNLKDGWSALAVALIAFGVTRLPRERVRAVVPPLVLGVAIMAVARAWILFVLVPGLVMGMLPWVFRGRGRAVVAIALVAGATGALVWLGAGEVYLRKAAARDIETIRESTERGGSAFEGGIQLGSPQAVLRSAPPAILQVIAAPYPWTVTNTRQALALPEILLWYAMIPFALRGLRRGVRAAPRAVWPLVGMAGAIVVAIALVEGNVGLIFRHRLQAFVIFFLFVAGGIFGAAAREGQREAEAEPAASG